MQEKLYSEFKCGRISMINPQNFGDGFLALIEIEDIYKIYKVADTKVYALDGISLSVDEGEFVAIVGASGSGKSTLMNMLGCLDAPTSGKVKICGEDIGTLSENRLSALRNKQIGFIFQGFNLIPTLSALENIELPLMYRKIPKKKRQLAAESAIASVGLWERRHHKPSQLSGGQQQRVAIARAIAAKPPIILADEPTGNLDSLSGGDITDILLDLNKAGRTVILITHDEKLAALSPRQIRIKDGRLV